MSKTTVGIHEFAIVLALGSDGKGARILARITQRSWDQLKLVEGHLVHAQIKSVAMAPGY